MNGPNSVIADICILRTNYTSKRIVSYQNNQLSDLFTKIDFVFEHAVASIKVGDGVKSEEILSFQEQRLHLCTCAMVEDRLF